MHLAGGQEPGMMSTEWLSGERSTGNELAECFEKAESRSWYDGGMVWAKVGGIIGWVGGNGERVDRNEVIDDC